MSELPMETPYQAPQSGSQTISWWIMSLAVSVVACATLFVVFAGYLVDIKESLAVSRMRIELVDQRLTEMNGDLESIRRRTIAKQREMNGLPPLGVPVQVAPAVPAPDTNSAH